jgi:hypothetical protein
MPVEPMMPAIQFDRDALAQWYATQHLQTDPGIRAVYYLPANSDEREIRFVEVNELLAERNGDRLEPIDFGVDRGTELEHTLFILDVTPGQWERIRNSSLALPSGWSLTGAVPLGQN